MTTTEPIIDAPAVQYWSGPIVVEGVPTGDKRRVMPDALTWRDLPLPLMFQRQTPEGRGNPHAGASLSGRITLLWQDGPTVMGAGPIDTGQDGADLARFMTDGPIGISVDLDDVDSQMECLETDAQGECVDGELQITKARIMGATACAFPAIPEAAISLVTADDYATLTADHAATVALAMEPHDFVDSGDGTCEACGLIQAEHNAAVAAASVHLDDPIVAAGGPLLPSESWFEDPGLHEPTPLQITDEGRIYGHLARWGQPHIALSGRTAPKSGTGYAYFKTGSRMASCDCPERGGRVEVATGTITLGTGHASTERGVAARDAIGHYDHTGYAIADVNAGEDQFGIWIAGALRPDVAEERVVELRGGSLSGDWRWIGGRQEMVAALVVNVPGFPIPKTTAHESEGRMVALVAAGIVMPSRPVSLSEHQDLESRLAITEARLARQSADLAALRPQIMEAHAARLGVIVDAPPLCAELVIDVDALMDRLER